MRAGYNVVQLRQEYQNGVKVGEKRSSQAIHILLRDSPGQFLAWTTLLKTLLHELAHCRFMGGEEHELGLTVPRTDEERRFRACVAAIALRCCAFGDHVAVCARYERRLNSEYAVLRAKMGAKAAAEARHERSQSFLYGGQQKRDGTYRYVRRSKQNAQSRRSRLAHTSRWVLVTASRMATMGMLGALVAAVVHESRRDELA